MKDEREFFCQSVQACKQSMYTLAYGILKHEEDAADVLQDAILKAYCNLDTLRDKRKFRSWMLSIVHNTAVEFLKKQRPTVDIDEQWGMTAEEGPLDAASRMTVWEAVQKLKLPYRTIVILFYYQDCSVRQIAEITESSEPAVRQQLSRARKMLAQILNREDFDDERI